MRGGRGKGRASFGLEFQAISRSNVSMSVALARHVRQRGRRDRGVGGSHSGRDGLSREI